MDITWGPGLEMAMLTTAQQCLPSIKILLWNIISTFPIIAGNLIIVMHRTISNKVWHGGPLLPMPLWVSSGFFSFLWDIPQKVLVGGVGALSPRCEVSQNCCTNNHLTVKQNISWFQCHKYLYLNT